MSQIDTEEMLSETTDQQVEDTGLKLVPVAESIRYRRRAQAAEKKNEIMADQLAVAKAQTEKMAEQLTDIQLDHELTRKLASAGAIDLEAAILIAKARIKQSEDKNLDTCVEQLRNQKQYLFIDRLTSTITTPRTAPAKDKVTNVQTILERAAKKASTTGNRKDLQEYLKLRRNYVH